MSEKTKGFFLRTKQLRCFVRDKIERYKIIEGQKTNKEDDINHQIRFLKIFVKNVAVEIQKNLIDWYYCQAISINIGGSNIILTRFFVLKQQSNLIFYFSFMRKPSDPPKKEDKTITMRTSRIYLIFDFTISNLFESCEVEIFLGVRDSFKEDLLNDLFKYDLLENKSYLPDPTLGSIPFKYLLLLPIKYPLETLEQCFPEYNLKFYGSLFFIF